MTNIATATELRHNTELTGLVKERTVQTCAKCPRCRVGVCMGGRWEKYFEGCSKCIHCNKCVASGNDEDWKTFQVHAQLCHNIPRAPEVENIKELPAAELSDGLPKNQCPWCGLIQQGSTSVHRKFCMKMPIRMWLARQRAISRSYNEDGNGKPCCHCGSVYSEAHARARHEKQCGERFAALGLEKNQGDFIPTSWEDTGLSEEVRINIHPNFLGCADRDAHSDFTRCTHLFLYRVDSATCCGGTITRNSFS